MISIITLCYREERKWGGKGGEAEGREERKSRTWGRKGKKGHQSPWRKFPGGRMLAGQLPTPPAPHRPPSTVPSLSDTAHPLDLHPHSQPTLPPVRGHALPIVFWLSGHHICTEVTLLPSQPPSSLPSGSPHWLHCEPQRSPSGGQAFYLPSLGLHLATTDIPGQPSLRKCVAIRN